MFQDFPEGRRHEVDLLVEVPPSRGRPTFLIHVEIERGYRTEFGRRLKRYSYQLHLRHAVPIVSLVVFVRGGRPGAHWVDRPERVLGQEIQRFRYLSLGLSRLPAEDLLDRPEPLAWALAALARPGRIGRARPRFASGSRRSVRSMNWVDWPIGSWRLNRSRSWASVTSLDNSMGGPFDGPAPEILVNS